MRVLSITHYTAMMGANRSWLHLLSGLQARGVQVLALCPAEGPVTEALRQAGIEVVAKPYANWAYTWRTPAFWLFPWRWMFTRYYLLAELDKVVESFKPDLVHSNSMAVSLGWQLAERHGLKHVWHIREHGVLDYRLIFPFGKKLFLQKLNNAQAIICISKAIQDALPEGITAHNYLIYNGIGSREALGLRKREKPAEKTGFTFLLIGLLHPSKQQHHAIEAFARIARQYPLARLIIAGSGRRIYTWKLRRLISQNRLEKQVEMKGYVPDPAILYREADVCLMCSCFEAMGRVTAEAMSYGKPVIGFNGGGTTELIDAGKNGFLYNHVPELSALMQQFLDTPALAANMRDAAFAKALDNFTDETYVEKCAAVFERALSRS